MPLYLGNQKLKDLYVGGRKIKEAWMVVGGVLRKVYSSFIASGGMRTADGQSGSTTPVKTTAWVADTATYPGSTIVSNGIKMRGTKTGATLKFAGTLYWSWSGNINLAAYVNGVQRGATLVLNIPNAYTNYALSGSITLDVADGEVVDLYYWAGQSFALTFRSGTKYWVE